MSTTTITIIVIAAVIAVVGITWYLQKTVRFAKGKYGKQSVKSILQRYAVSRNFKVLENVQIELEGKTQTIDFVLVGFFGVIFVSALQGKGDFYGDFTEEYWSFVDEENQKIRFLNPVFEMDKKIEMFRRVAAHKKMYNIKVEPAIVVVSSKADAPLYLSHVREDNLVMNVSQFKKFLLDEKFEKDNNVDMNALVDLMKNLHD